MSPDWMVIEDGETLAKLVDALPDDEWTAVAVPREGPHAAVFTAVWKGGRVWCFIDIKRPILPMTLCRGVKAFHDCLRAGGVDAIYGLRAERASPRWMEWLGAERTGETIDGSEVWAWRS